MKDHSLQLLNTVECNTCNAVVSMERELRTIGFKALIKEDLCSHLIHRIICGMVVSLERVVGHFDFWLS